MKIKIEIKEVPKGHTEHTTGSGVHKDKRTKRNRTRSDNKRNDIKERYEPNP
jgi:hypothetical protein